MNSTFIRRVKLSGDFDDSVYPFSIPAVKQIESVSLDSSVTFFVGENGTGKSTLVEALAVAAGFNAEGGTKNYNFSTENTTSSLADHLTLIRGAKREKSGYFLRAESFYTTANYAESGTWPGPILFEGKHIHEQSHGEAFLSIVRTFRPGLFIFDEPESALSPQRLLSLMSVVHSLARQGSQFIIATHSPILLAYPEATIYELAQSGMAKTEYDDIEHVRMTKDFLSSPGTYLRKLFLE